jgi:hypothetical protein
MRVPESTSMLRVIGFWRSEINHFFENLTSALAGVDPSRLFNFDETGLSILLQHLSFGFDGLIVKKRKINTGSF